MLASQIALLLVLPVFGWFNPVQDLWSIAVLAFAVAFFSATQDIVIDAFRREILPDAELGLGTSIHVNAYRVAGLIPGSLALILADHLPWGSVFFITALFMLPGIAMSIMVSEPAIHATLPRTLREAVIEPFHEFVTRLGWRPALLMLLFVVLYKLGDNMAVALATPFYLDMGFTKTDIGAIAKHAGLWPAVAGALLGGLWMVKLGINRALWIFGVVQMVVILGMAVLARMPGNLWMLATAISFEYFGIGLGTVASIAFMARATNPAYTATQYALFTSLAAIPRVVVSAGTGWLVEQTGWFNFFLICTLMALPGMLLLPWVAPWRQDTGPGQPVPGTDAQGT
jgi:PAT family beta-lactamase induction signal transducer AmpG